MIWTSVMKDLNEIVASRNVSEIFQDLTKGSLLNPEKSRWQGICISRPLAFCLAPGLGPQFVFTGLDPQFVLTGPGPQFVFNSPGRGFVFTDPDPELRLAALVPNLYLLTQVSNLLFTSSGQDLLLLPQLLVLSLQLPSPPPLLLLLPVLLEIITTRDAFAAVKSTLHAP